MRHLHCAKCGARSTPGRRQAYAADVDGPAEWERIVRGRAKMPTPEQRDTNVNGTPVPLTLEHFDCDLCGDPIRPGDVATAITAWQPSRQQEPRYWEADYLLDPRPSADELAAELRAVLEQEPRP